MTNSRSIGPTAEALRKAGFIPVPRVWVTREDLEMILWMAKKHEPAVNEIRARVKQELIRAGYNIRETT